MTWNGRNQRGRITGCVLSVDPQVSRSSAASRHIILRLNGVSRNNVSSFVNARSTPVAVRQCASTLPQSHRDDRPFDWICDTAGTRAIIRVWQCYNQIVRDELTLWRPLLPYGYSYKASCAPMATVGAKGLSSSLLTWIGRGGVPIKFNNNSMNLTLKRCTFYITFTIRCFSMEFIPIRFCASVCICSSQRRDQQCCQCRSRLTVNSIDPIRFLPDGERNRKPVFEFHLA